MTKTKFSMNARDSQTQAHLSEADVALLVQQAAQQYEECMRLADLADISDQGEVNHQRYAWDNPIGLVVTSS